MMYFCWQAVKPINMKWCVCVCVCSQAVRQLYMQIVYFLEFWTVFI